VFQKRRPSHSYIDIVRRKYASLENPKTKATQSDDPSVYRGYDNEIFIHVGDICYDTWDEQQATY
jgi:hypothetical protein